MERLKKRVLQPCACDNYDLYGDQALAILQRPPQQYGHPGAQASYQHNHTAFNAIHLRPRGFHSDIPQTTWLSVQYALDNLAIQALL